MKIRPAYETDIQLIRRMADLVFPATYGAILSSAQLRYMMEWMYGEEALRREINGGFAWFIATVEEEPSGYLSIEQLDDELFCLQKIYVLPKYQGLGGGELLFNRAVEYIRSVHPTPCRMELHVNRNNQARQFYEKMGMQLLREGDFEIGNGFYMNDFIMGLEIR